MYIQFRCIKDMTLKIFFNEHKSILIASIINLLWYLNNWHVQIDLIAISLHDMQNCTIANND